MRLLAIASIAIIAIAPVAPISAQSTAPAASTSAAPDNDADQQIRCRRIAITGSLVRRERMCKTVAEWRRLSDRGNEVARAQLDEGRMCAGGLCGNGN
jgi:hypothetical protein